MELNSIERRQLAAILGCDEGALDERLIPFFEAAHEEYVRMMLGQRVFTRGSDMREYRLLLLIRHTYNRLPSEQEISAVFQTSAAQSRSLLRAVMSKFQYELQSITHASLTELLDEATGAEDGDRTVLIRAENFVEALNREISMIDGRLQPVSKQPGTTSAYTIPKDTYAKLKERFESDHG